MSAEAGEWLSFGIAVASALVLSHVCSLLEAALLSITPSQIALLRQRSSRTGQLVFALKREIERPIAVILIVNTAAHTIGAAVAGANLNALFHGRYMEVFSLVFTLVMVQYTEILPKTVGVRFNTAILRWAARPLNVLTVVLGPLIKLCHLVNRPFEGGRPRSPSATEEISALASLARSSQMISSRQERIIRMAPHLSERKAREVMIGVDNISFMSSGQTLNDALVSAGRDFHTRYPVCEDRDRDRILGYVNFKELVAKAQAHPDSLGVMDILRPPDFAEPDDSAAELLERFASQHCHMMIVRDPADGRTLGLVTLEDIVEELLGDLDDEFDPLPRTLYSPGEALWVVGGGVPLTLLMRETNLDLPRRVEPVSNWFVRTIDRVPKVGDMLRYHNAELYVRKIRRGQVWEFNLKRITEELSKMWQRIFAAAALALAVSGCVSFDYVGQDFPELSESRPVAMFEDRSEIPAGQYAIIGRGVMVSKRAMDRYDMEEELAGRARRHGADAFCIISTEKIKVGSFTVDIEPYIGVRSANANPGNLNPDGSPIEINSFGNRQSLEEVNYRYEYVTRVIFLKDRLQLAEILKERDERSTRERRELDLPPEPETAQPKAAPETPAAPEGVKPFQPETKRVESEAKPQPVTPLVVVPASPTAPAAK